MLRNQVTNSSMMKGFQTSQEVLSVDCYKALHHYKIYFVNHEAFKKLQRIQPNETTNTSRKTFKRIYAKVSCLFAVNEALPPLKLCSQVVQCL